MANANVQAFPDIVVPLSVVIPINTAIMAAGVDLYGCRAVGIQMPAAWDAANLTFQGSADGTTYFNVYDKAGTEYTVTAAASRYIILNRDDMLGIRYLIIRSGTAGVPVNQTAARTLVLQTQAVK